jgi:chromosome segregation ATPase
MSTIGGESMDITKYLKNKEIQLSQDDIDIEKLEKDIRKGYVSSEEVDKARQEVKTEATTQYTALEEKYNKLEKSYNDIETRNTELTNNIKAKSLEVEMVSQGFKKENLAEISALRNSLYKDEEDDAKAISAIKEKYKATYFPEPTEKPIDVPNETKLDNGVKAPAEIKITRNTSIKDLIIK